MTKTLSLLWFAVLAAIALLHGYWGLGGLWPGSTEQELINIVVGDPAMVQMFPMQITLVVTGLIFLAGLFALMAGGTFQIFPRWSIRIATGVLTIVFTGRAVSGFYAAQIDYTFTEPFGTYDLWFYSPLCLILGLGFAYLTITARKAS
jgi:hypothetical protein